MNSLERSLILKTGQETGWENVLEDYAAQIALASARHPARATVTFADDRLVVAFTGEALCGELMRDFGVNSTDGGRTFAVPYSPNRLTVSLSPLSKLLRRAAELAGALPDQAVNDFAKAIHDRLETEYVTSTEIERLVRQRVGQDVFREALMKYWGGACAVTGVAVPEVLRASHCKPWAECESDSERLDVYNGLLLSANLDALFDRGLITFDDAGGIVISSLLPDEARASLRLAEGQCLRWIAAPHSPFLAYHRAHVYRR